MEEISVQYKPCGGSDQTRMAKLVLQTALQPAFLVLNMSHSVPMGPSFSGYKEGSRDIFFLFLKSKYENVMQYSESFR